MIKKKCLENSVGLHKHYGACAKFFLVMAFSDCITLCMFVCRAHAGFVRFPTHDHASSALTGSISGFQ